MSLNYSLITIQEFLEKKGYSRIERGLVVFGGKNNGTVDLKATKEDMTKSIIIEIKDNPVHIIDLSHFLSIKRNIEAHNPGEQLIFYLLTTDKETSRQLKDIAKTKGIIIINIDEFLNMKTI